MDQILCLTFLFCLVLCCQGLELSLNRDIPIVLGKRTFCGVLVCTENTRSLTSDNDTLDSTVSFNSILSMSVFKKVPHDDRVDASNRRDTLVATVTTQNPSLTRVANGMQVAGSLDSTGASVRVELVKTEDCEAEFSCHVRGEDSQGRESVSAVSLVQQLRQKGQGEDLEDVPLVSSLSLQLLTSIQLLITQSMGRLEDKMSEMNKETNNKFDSFLKKIEDQRREMSRDTSDQMNTFERRIDSLESKLNDDRTEIIKVITDQMNTFERHIEQKLDLFENRVEDKVDNNNNLNKLVQLDVKVSTALTDFRTQATRDIAGSLNNLSQEMQTEQKTALIVFSENIEETLNKTSGLLSSMKDDFDLLKSYGQTNLLTIRNETARIQDELDSQKNVCQMLRNDTTDLIKDMSVTFKEFESTTKNMSSSTRSQLKDSFSYLEQKMSKNVETLTEVIVPRTCKKGMLPVTSFSYFSLMTYAEHGLNFLFLCDTVTDNGGWILIQRRSTGNINFGQSWADYKQGFGSIDGDFWLGNDNIHTITSSGTYELRVELRYKGKEAFAHYATFSITDENDKYKLQLGAYDGTAGDSLTYHSGGYFSTIDVDNDGFNLEHCSINHGGGWWFKSCDSANLNGNWGVESDYGVEWTAYTGSDSASYTEMKIRKL